MHRNDKYFISIIQKNCLFTFYYHLVGWFYDSVLRWMVYSNFTIKVTNW